MNVAEFLLEKIKTKKIIVGIVGLGYVGSYLAALIVKKGIETIGFDISQKRVDTLKLQGKKLLRATTDMSLLRDCDVILICVQTPVDENKLPDLRFLIAATEQTAAFLRKGQLVIVESSIATGTTRNVVFPLLEKVGLVHGSDYFLAFSPERVDPGNKNFTLDQIPKVVSGLDGLSLQLTVVFYEQIMKQVVPVTSLETAEMVKLVENTFRLVNISLVNELSVYAKSWNVDMWEVIKAAATKPFGFMPHYPSPGVGGHCIPIDPFYLFEDAKKRGVYLSLIDTAGKINDAQPKKVVQRAIEILKGQKVFDKKLSETGARILRMFRMRPVLNLAQQTFPLAGQKGGKSLAVRKKGKHNILLVGLSYKPDVDDVRESPALHIWRMLEKSGCSVAYHDPHVPLYKGTASQSLTPDVLDQQDLIIIVTNHSMVDYAKLASQGIPVLDTRNAYSNGSKQPHIYSL